MSKVMYFYYKPVYSFLMGQMNCIIQQHIFLNKLGKLFMYEMPINETDSDELIFMICMY